MSPTSPINYLILIGEIEILPRLLGEILIPPAVHRELLSASAPPAVHQWARNLPTWARIVKPLSIDNTLDLGAGETEAIALATEVKAALLLIDERLGRKAARERSLRTIGTLLILSEADERGLLDFERTVKRLLETTFRASPEIVDFVRKRLLARKQQG